MEIEKFQYDNKIVKHFAYATMLWGIVGMLAGLVAAYSLNGFTGMGDFVYDWFGLPRAVMGMVWKLLFGSEAVSD